MKKRKALLLCNMGTPDEPTPPKVRAYLREFLMDPFVVDLAWPLRFALVEGAILPRRSHASAEAYKKIWTAHGSPLLVYLRELAEKAQAALGGEEWIVKPVMRYGNPSVEGAVEALRAEGIDEIVFFPLYPQYSAATTESSVRALTRALARKLPHAQVRIIPPFYDSPLFLEAFAEVAHEGMARAGVAFDHVLFSFHGLPERQIKKAESAKSHGACITGAICDFASPGSSESARVRYDCCADQEAHRRGCYRAQCLHTARELGRALGLGPERYTVTFQSRLGRTPWIGPYTDQVLVELARKGVRRLAVLCPAFVADCLETLEEIAMRNRELFQEHGGEDLVLVPSLNSHPTWVRAVVQLGAAHAGSAHSGSLMTVSS